MRRPPTRTRHWGRSRRSKHLSASEKEEVETRVGGLPLRVRECESASEKTERSRGN